MQPPPADRPLRPGDIVAVSRCADAGPITGRIDQIHWNPTCTWISLVDVDTGEWRSARLESVIGRLEDYDPAPRPMREPVRPLIEMPDLPIIGIAHAD